MANSQPIISPHTRELWAEYKQCAAASMAAVRMVAIARQCGIDAGAMARLNDARNRYEVDAERAYENYINAWGG
jgi:hypothetical protein